MEIPQWLQTLIVNNLPAFILSGTGATVITFLLTRRQYSANVGNTETATLKMMVELNANLVSQLKTAQEALPTYQDALKVMAKEKEALARIAVLHDDELEQERKEKADLLAQLGNYENREPLGRDVIREMRTKATMIIENVDRLSYRAMPGEIEDPLEPRFRAIKEACAWLKALRI